MSEKRITMTREAFVKHLTTLSEEADREWAEGVAETYERAHDDLWPITVEEEVDYP